MSDLIPLHLQWMKAKGQSKRTMEDRKRVLVHANAQLPWGLDDADPAEIAAYLGQWSGWTLHTYHVHLAGYYRWGCRVGHHALDPMLTLDRPPEGPRVPNPCSTAELQTALAGPEQPWRRAILLAAYAGLRCCEIVSVRRQDIADDRGLRIVGKGGRVRVVPVADPLWAEIEDAPKGLLCVGARGAPLTAQMLTQMQRAVWRRLGLPDEFRLHRARHWFATNLLDGGADIRHVQELLGHASLHSTQGYTKVTARRLAGAVALLPRLNQPARGSVTSSKTSEPESSRLGRATEAA